MSDTPQNGHPMLPDGSIDEDRFFRDGVEHVARPDNSRYSCGDLCELRCSRFARPAKCRAFERKDGCSVIFKRKEKQ